MAPQAWPLGHAAPDHDGPPHWPVYPPGRAYGTLKGNDPLLKREITRLGARLLAHDLHALGINVDCVPVLDVPTPGAHDIIGDRAYGDDVATVATLDVRNANEHYVLRSAATPGATFVPAWNAWRTNVP